MRFLLTAFAAFAIGALPSASVSQNRQEHRAASDDRRSVPGSAAEVQHSGAPVVRGAVASGVNVYGARVE